MLQYRPPVSLLKKRKKKCQNVGYTHWQWSPEGWCLQIFRFVTTKLDRPESNTHNTVYTEYLFCQAERANKMKVLGLDIGSNSIGSAWVDFDNSIFSISASVFPAGVEDSDKGRGDPKNLARRSARSQRRSLRRRALRKRQMKKALQNWGWMPKDPIEQKSWFNMNPWHLRREALERELSAHELGRLLLHMVQRRGAAWFDEDETQASGATKGPKAASDALLAQLGNKTYGQFMADLFDAQTTSPAATQPIRNRNTAEGSTDYKYFPQRQLLRNEFMKIWDFQKSLNSALSTQLTKERQQELSNPSRTDTWKYRGLLFGQRNTYWDAGTLGRCDLEPTDHPCTIADMYAQEFLLLQELNNIRVAFDDEKIRPLTDAERGRVTQALIQTKKPTAATVRNALAGGKKSVKDSISLNLDHDKKKVLNSNWFAREIIPVFGEEAWHSFDEKKKDSINKAICKFDPRDAIHVEKMTAGAEKWWNLDKSQVDKFIIAWKTRPAAEKRVSLSRRAICNLLPYIRHGMSVTEARQAFAEDAENGASNDQRRRYALGYKMPNHAIRHFLKKHPDLLPPAPMIANPVVRKSIHEVRRHVSAYIRKYGCKPDRIIIELARDAKITKQEAANIYADNKDRRDIRDDIRQKYIEENETLKNKPESWKNKAIDRVLLCLAQNKMCAYSNLDSDSPRQITQRQAAEGENMEIDHLFPRSRGGSNSLSNKVLCYASSNRSKGNNTPKEWLSESEFETMKQRFAHWNQDGASKQDRKRWKFLNMESSELGIDDFIQSNLTDTAYASKQVAQWLDEVLYGGTSADTPWQKRRVFATNGKYTSLLRHNWGLYYDQREGEIDYKSRADHRHHAIDALVIACSGPERIQQVVSAFKEQELHRGEAKQFTIPTPWGNHDSFRAEIIDAVKNLVVSHRPESRKLIGAFHNDTLFGPIIEKNGQISDNNFTKRKFIINLSPNHLRMPEYWEDYYEKYQSACSQKAAKEIRQQMDNLPDVNSGKGNPGVVRDKWMRQLLRDILKQNNINPNKFTENNVRQLIRDDKFRLPSGVPIKHIKLRVVLNNSLPIRRKMPDGFTYETKPKALRIYDPQNNHHIEIRQGKKGKWNGQVITTFDAAKRIRPAKSSEITAKPAMIDKSINENGNFLMSLCIGETVWMKHPNTKEDGYFCVFRLEHNTAKIHFTPHWDAGKSKDDEKFPAREDISISPQQLQKLAPDGQTAPQKVWVGPLGEVKILKQD